MVDDKEVILGLIKGIKSQSGTIEVRGVNFEGDVQLENSTVSGNQATLLVSIIPVEIEEEAVELLQELGEMIDDPSKDESRIKEIMSWFEKRIPTVYYTLASLRFAENLGF